MRRCAIITGSARGIGAATAVELAGEGHDVMLNCRTDDNMEQLENIIEKCQSLGARTAFIIGDVSTEDVCIEIVEQSVEIFGKIDLLVNNAGVSCRKPLTNMLIEDFDMVMRNNLYSTFLMMKHAAPILKKRKNSSIVNIASVAGIYGSAGDSAYAASKAGIISLTKTGAKELAPNIRVNAIAPGMIETEAVRAIPEG